MSPHPPRRRAWYATVPSRTVRRCTISGKSENDRGAHGGPRRVGEEGAVSATATAKPLTGGEVPRPASGSSALPEL